MLVLYALLDNASGTTFIKTSTLKDLGGEGPELKMKLYTMHGNAERPVQKVDGLVVKRFDKKVKIELPKTYSHDSIPSRCQTRSHAQRQRANAHTNKE